ncbi:MAG: hypothetical protein JXK16_00705 [Thiotrichales bacterium]|nr:hypothetical protein [Thiotrichales bacterium]
MKYVFYISNQSLTVYQDRNQLTEWVKTFLWSQQNEIDTFLTELPSKSPVSIVLDLAEEDIALEPFPKLYLWEKNSVRDQHINDRKEDGVDLVNTQWSGQIITSNEGRAEELLLTSSITSPPQLVNFLSILEDAQIMLTGIYSAPFLLSSYFNTELSEVFGLSKEQIRQPFFIISRQSDISYRQTFFNQSGIRISRLIELDKDASDYDGLKTALIHETKLAKNYVYNQTIVSAEEEVSYIFMDGDHKRLEGLEKLAKTSGLINDVSIDSGAFFKSATFSPDTAVLETSATDLYASKSLADFVFRQNPPNFYSTAYVTKITNLILGSRSLIAVNTLVLLALLIYITVSAVDWYMGQQRLDRLDTSIANHQVEKERLQKVVNLQIDAEEIKASVEFSEAILKLKNEGTLGFDVKPITDVVASQSEHIQIMKLDWKKQGKFDSTIYDIDFQGLVYPFIDYYRDPVMWVDTFRDELAKLENVKNVRIVKEPLNRDLKQALTIVVNNNSKVVDALPFQIKMEVQYEPSK